MGEGRGWGRPCNWATCAQSSRGWGWGLRSPETGPPVQTAKGGRGWGRVGRARRGLPRPHPLHPWAAEHRPRRAMPRPCRAVPCHAQHACTTCNTAPAPPPRQGWTGAAACAAGRAGGPPPATGTPAGGQSGGGLYLLKEQRHRGGGGPCREEPACLPTRPPGLLPSARPPLPQQSAARHLQTAPAAAGWRRHPRRCQCCRQRRRRPWGRPAGSLGCSSAATNRPRQG